jgi:hypothetical protein
VDAKERAARESADGDVCTENEGADAEEGGTKDVEGWMDVDEEEVETAAGVGEDKLELERDRAAPSAADRDTASEIENERAFASC